MKKMIIGGLVAGGLILGAAGLVLGAGIAKADTGYDVPGYLNAIQRDGFNTYRAVQNGFAVCADLERGVGVPNEIDAMKANNPWMLRPMAAAEVIDAQLYLCDDTPFEPTPPPVNLPGPPPLHQMVGYVERGGEGHHK